MYDIDFEKEKKEPTRCSYVVPRKKRNCRMLVKPGKKYCGEHDITKSIDKVNNHSDGATDIRIVCPNDSKHTCNANRLEKHLKVCPSKPKPVPEFCSKGINSAPRPINETKNKLTVGSATDKQLIDIIKRIEKFYKDQCFDERIKTEILTHNVVESHILENPDFGPAALKHLKQNSSLLAYLEKYIKTENEDDITYVEFGSGRGQLTYWVARAFEKISNNENAKSIPQTETSINRKFILIDKASHRHKYDNKLKDENASLDISRVRVDIEDLVLKKIDPTSSNIVAISKHLCGAATDLAITSLVNYVRDEIHSEKEANTNTVQKPLLGLMIALCCHHRCEWHSFVGKKYLAETAGFVENEFSLLCGLTSWATCGSGKPRDSVDAVEPSQTPLILELPETDQLSNISIQAPLHGNNDVQPIDYLNRYEKLDLNQCKREEIGRKTKRILDAARAHFVKENMGLKFVELKYYTTKDISLENVVIICNN